VGKRLLFKAITPIVHLYHGENKLIVNEMMMMMSALYSLTRLVWF